MIGDVDRLFLRRAVELGTRGLHSVSGNPRVGCLIVRDGEVLGRGWHRRAGGPHAEENALRDAGGDARGATVYVSLEPCRHTGRRPPCVDALISHGVARVVVALGDPDPRVDGRGCQALRDAGVPVEVEALACAAELNAGYLKRMRQGLPYVRVKMAASLDGRAAMAHGESQWITSAEARSDAQRWRARSSAIVTGIGTVLADDPALTVREERFAEDGLVRQPLVAVLDSRGRTPATARLFAANATTPVGGPHGHARAARIDRTTPPPGNAQASAGERKGQDKRQGKRKVLLFCGGQAPKTHPNAEVVRAPGAVDLGEVLQRLAAQACDEVLVEAGPTLTGAFLRQGLWDEAVIYLAPKLLGTQSLPLARFAVDRLADSLLAKVCAVHPIGPDIRVALRRAEPQVA